MDTQSLTVRLPRDLYEWLRQAAFDQRRSQASVIADAISEYRDKHSEADGNGRAR